MVNAVKARGKIPVLATVTRNSVSASLAVRANSYNDKIRELATQYDIVLADQYTALNNNWSVNNSGDGLHISNAGYVRMTAKWYEKIADVLEAEAMPSPTPVVSSILLLLLD